MKSYFPLLLLLATGCGSKTSDPAAKTADPDAVPAGQHLIKVVYTGSGWGSAVPGLFIYQDTQNTAGKEVYHNVVGPWTESVDAANGHILRLAYRDTAFALHFEAGMRGYTQGSPKTTNPAATLTAKAYVDGRLQWTNSIDGTATYNDHEWLIDTKNLK